MSTITNTIADLIREGGLSRARAESRRGAILGSALANIGQTIGSIPAQIQQRQAQGQQNQIRALEIEEVRARADQRKRANDDVAAIDSAMQSGDADRAVIMQRLTESGRGHLLPALQKTWADADKYGGEAKKAAQEADARKNDYFASLASGAKALGADADAFEIMLSDAEKRGYDASQERQLLQTNPEKLAPVLDMLIARSPKFAQQKPAAPTTASIAMDAAKGDPSKALELLNADKTADNARADKAAIDTAAYQRDMVRIAQLNAESNRIRATKPAAGAAGPKPRNVTSGDANRLAEITTGLNDLGQLQNKIGTTGPGSQLAAEWVPNWMTAWTGLGADSKSRQAVIDTIKQIIGKSLEGGVLRKEDEIKYEKILPRIGDAPAVAASKIGGLKETLGAKREDLMSALEDAGYDTTRFRARTGATTAAPSMRYNPATGKVEPIK